MWIKACNHAPNSAFDKLSIIRVFDIIALYDLESLREGLQLFIGIRLGLYHPLTDDHSRQQDYQRGNNKFSLVNPNHIVILRLVLHMCSPEKMSRIYMKISRLL